METADIEAIRREAIRSTLHLAIQYGGIVACIKFIALMIAA